MTDGDRDTWIDWVTKLEEQGVNLTKWEEDFVQSVKQQLMFRGLSERQAEILERIYAEKTP